MSCNEEMVKIIGVLNELQDKLSTLGITNLVKVLPQIVVIGSQSAGKSSVLESFVGRDFLPRGKDIVTRRPLILQLIQNRNDSRTFAKFNHSQKIFTNFDEIRTEIETETDRTVPDSRISADPINLMITSPDVLDLNLVDLPGMTKVPVGNQPEDIEAIVKRLIIDFISNENSLILAVTPANQDLSTSDAIKLAREVDPEGKRTIGVLTKLDLMGDGTNARNILLNEHKIKLRRGFIGVINRSQKDIEDNMDLRQAMAKEKDYFSQHPSYRDLINKLGVDYLQKYLQKELAKHLFDELPVLRDRFDNNLFELNERIDKIGYPIENLEINDLYSDTIELFRKNFKNEIGNGDEVPVDRLNGGAKINIKMNVKYPEDIDNISRDENRIKKEIQTAVQNSFGTRLELFVPNKVFSIIVRNQLELMRRPSLKCVESVWSEIESIVRESAKGIGRFPNLMDLFVHTTLECVRECKKRCVKKVEHKLDTEKAYFNTIHEDFIKEIESKKIKSSHEVPLVKFLISRRQDESIDDPEEFKSGWIKFNGVDYLFTYSRGLLEWFADESKNVKKGSINLIGAQVEFDGTPTINISKNGIQMELEFDTDSNAEEWKRLLELSQSSGSVDDSFDNITDYPINIRPQVEEVMKLVLAYIGIMEKTFKDALPKLCQKELIDATENFIGVKLRNKIQGSFSTIEELVGGDPLEEERKDLLIKKSLYEEALQTIDMVLKPSVGNQLI